MSDFKKLHVSVFESAMANIKRGGVLAPVGILCTERTKEINTIHLHFQTDKEKVQNFAALGATAFLTKADYVFIAHDVCIGTPEEWENGVYPTEKPMDDKREVVLVLGIELGAVPSHVARFVEYRRSGPDRKTISFLESGIADTHTNFNEGIAQWFMDGFKMAKWNAEHLEVDALTCEHGRRLGRPCPHCLGQPKAPDGPAA